MLPCAYCVASLGCSLVTDACFFVLVLTHTRRGVPFFFLPYCQKLWHVVLVNAAGAPGTGMFLGVVYSSPSQYLANVWPKQVARGRAVYFQMATVGTIFAPKLIMGTLKARDLKAAFFLCGALVFVAAIPMLWAMLRFKKAIAKIEKEKKLSPREAAEMQATGAVPVDEFLGRLQDNLARWLPERHYHLSNGRVQDLIERLIDDALPTICEYDEDPEQGSVQQHLEDVASLYWRLGDDEAVRALEQRHPEFAPLLHLDDDESRATKAKQVVASSIGMSGIHHGLP